MITDEKIKSNTKQLDLEITNKILAYKEKYSPEELKSIIGFIDSPVKRLIAMKLLLE